MKTVYVVTGLNLGWDCVVGVYDADEVSIDELAIQFPDPEEDGEYMIHEMQLSDRL